jgi:predicted phage baseplate assembly protein
VEREPADKASLLDDVREVVKDLRKAHRAVTGSDFEELVLEEFKGRIARARCVPRRNLTVDDPEMRGLDKPGRVSLIIVPGFDDGQTDVKPTGDLIRAVKEYLEPLRLLTTRLHVVGPRYVSISVRLTLIIEPDAVAEVVKDKAVKELNRFFHPLGGGHDGKGWPFGRNVYVSEIYELLDLLPGVDYVTRTIDKESSRPLDELITSDPDRIKRNSQGDFVAIELLPDELVSANISKELLSIPPGGEESKVRDDD